MNIDWLASLILLLWLITVAVMDLRYRKVRNWMVVLGLFAGTAALFSGGQPFQTSAWSGLAGMLAAFAALLPFYALRWMGAGDVKFAAVIGLWTGLAPQLLSIWLGGSLLAGFHGLLVLFWRRLQRSSWGLRLMGWLPAPLSALLSADGSGRASPPGTLSLYRPVRSIPYAGYLSIAAIWVLWRMDVSL
ncbi:MULTISPECIES: A24 family peptidase [Delftia]|jgi:prepilin peptidase CpaA|uniref:Prepilin peptidase CpaA n=1 Tax=Delftia lacustris TaxID=558537 RepID=A0A1H3MED2_9BURK|nr:MULTISPECIES: prepilin peptidase [Delftia]MXN32488.1 prepilin peptidase [Delftia sp. CH05]SDY75062.1 prepilin peptidase CpaA [Delftia lacustris]